MQLSVVAFTYWCREPYLQLKHPLRVFRVDNAPELVLLAFISTNPELQMRSGISSCEPTGGWPEAVSSGKCWTRE